MTEALAPYRVDGRNPDRFRTCQAGSPDVFATADVSAKTVALIGIDPGQTGAAGLVDENGGYLDHFDWPGDSVAAAYQLMRWIAVYDVRAIAVESIAAFKGQGVSSTCKFCRNAGQWEGIASVISAVHDIPLLIPLPREWQKGLLRKTDGSEAKDRSLAAARRLFPIEHLKYKKHNGRADALLMAYQAAKGAL